MAKLICCTKDRVYVSSEPKRLDILNYEGGVEAQINSEAEITAICAKDTKFVICYNNHNIEVFNADNTAEPIHTFQVDRLIAQIEFAEYEGKEALLMCNKSDVLVYVLEGATDKKVKPTILMGHIATITTFALSPDGTRLASGDRDGRVRISKFPQAYDIVQFCLKHAEFVTSVAYDAECNVFAADGDGQVSKWTKDGDLVKINQTFAKKSIISQISAFDGKIAAFLEGKDELYILDAESLEIASTVELPCQPLCMDISEKNIFVGCNGNVVLVEEGKAKSIMEVSKMEKVPTKDKLRVNRKEIVDPSDKESKEYNHWRFPEEEEEKE